LERLAAATPDAGVRKEMAAALSLHDDPRLVVAAVRRVMDAERDDEVRGEAVAWLGRHARADSGATRVILDAVRRDPSPHVRDEALGVLGDADVPESDTLLTAMARTAEQEDARKEAVEIIGRRGGAGAVATLERVAWDDRSGEVRIEAVDALFRIASADAVRVLARLRDDHQDEDVRVAAAEAVARLRRPR
jgi:HEAT repeat protein